MHLTISNKKRAFPEALHRMCGVGGIYEDKAFAAYRLEISSLYAIKKVLSQVRRYLILKWRQAEVALALRSSKPNLEAEGRLKLLNRRDVKRIRDAKVKEYAKGLK